MSDTAPVVSAHAPQLSLAVANGVGAGKRIVLRRAVSVIGSQTGCKLLLKHQEISRTHCLIVNTGQDIYLRDLNSHKGTYLNDLRAEHERLQDGDVISINPWRFQIGLQTPPPSGDNSNDYTGISLEPAPAAIALEDLVTGQITKLPREVNLLGRGYGCDLVFDNRSVSRAHAIIFTYLSNVVVCDLLSQNGVMLNNRLVSFSIINSNDVLSLGEVAFRIRLIAPTPHNQVGSNNNNGSVRAPELDGTFTDRIDIRSAEGDRK